MYTMQDRLQKAWERDCAVSRDHSACASPTPLCTGGIYIQEPDASAAAVSALTRLVAMYPESFPLGFAYGHLPGRAPFLLWSNMLMR